MKRTLIKVCGMRDTENIRAAEKLDIDWMGFIFYPKSKRYAGEDIAYIPKSKKRIGVFVDADAEEIENRVKTFALNGIQLHGSESAEHCQMLRRKLHQAGVADIILIKALGIATADDIATVGEYQKCCDYLLFDTKTPLKGGSGQSFDWSVINCYRGDTPFLLSGGIGSDSFEALKNMHHPKFAGIDLNSKFEISPALKDINSLKSFITKFRNNE